MAIEERELDDADLVSAAQEGDTEAFAELFRRHYPAVRRICARRLGNLADADEVAQAAFVRAYERIDQCGGERRFGAWVQVIAYRLGADARRLQARAMPTDEPVIGDAALGPNSCEDALLRAERVAEVRQMLATLPPRQREVIIARDLEGRRPGEIAASLGLSLGAVDSLLLRARRRMASAWQAATVEPGAASLQVTAASLVATTMARPGAVGRAVDALDRVVGGVNRVSLQVAHALGVVPGAPSTAQSLGRLAATSAVLVIPAVGIMSAIPAPSPGTAALGGHASLPALALPAVHPPAGIGSVPVTPSTTVAIPVLPTSGLSSLPGVAAPSFPDVSASSAPTAAVLPTVGQAVGGVVSAVSATVSAVGGVVSAAAGTVTTLAGQVTSGLAVPSAAPGQSVPAATPSPLLAGGSAPTATLGSVVPAP